MANLDPQGTPVELGKGYVLAAPGLEGTARLLGGEPAGTRDVGEQEVSETFESALTNSDMREMDAIVVEAAHRGVSGDRQVRTTGGEDGMVLEVPDLGPAVGQVVLAVDEAGALSWHHPEATSDITETSTMRGAGDRKRFVIRSTSPPRDREMSSRSLISSLGKKVLKVLTYPIAGTPLQVAARFFARKWEEKKRPYAVRWFAPGNYRESPGEPISGEGWKRLSEGRALLFVHGTFSRSFSGFWGLPNETMQRFDDLYSGRVFAFDHFTLSHDPERNVVEFLDQIPSGVRLNLDIISHSRGGLVARALAGETSSGPIPGVEVERAVFVATPNHGTALADADHLMAFIDRHTSILNLIPPGPHSVVLDVLEGIITAVKMIGRAALGGLPGLLSMDPDGPFLQRMNNDSSTSAEYYAVAADFEPKGGLGSIVSDGVVDRVFGDAGNDLVVPTLGVFSGSHGAGFPIPTQRLLEFSASDAVNHSGFFSDPRTSEALLGWLS
ncbi:MAG: hypothetical protein R3258_02940 [Acidimicrobiia bacterium]|nr:hypothetical protein [Acidimicrobiia bacterium]